MFFRPRRGTTFDENSASPLGQGETSGGFGVGCQIALGQASCISATDTPSAHHCVGLPPPQPRLHPEMVTAASHSPLILSYSTYPPLAGNPRLQIGRFEFPPPTEEGRALVRDVGPTPVPGW